MGQSGFCRIPHLWSLRGLINQWMQNTSYLLIGILIGCFTGFGQNVWSYKDVLRDDIDFWKSIFSRYSHNQYVLHDSYDLNLLYKVLTFDSSVSVAERESRLKKEKEQIKDVLLNLAEQSGKNKDFTDFEKHLIRSFGGSIDPDKLRLAAGQVRAQQGMRQKFEAGIRRSLAYLPFLKQVFRDRNLPEELAFLPHVESSFNPLASSRVGAAGMWQFMRSTARLYMKVNRIIDQRFDPLISTRAAARLLASNYQKTGDWGLAITAYNYGLAGILRAMERYGRDYLSVRESLKTRRFGFASRNFYPEFLAVIELIADRQTYFTDLQPVNLPARLSFQLKQPVNLPRLVKSAGLDLTELRALNPTYTYRVWRGWVRVPSGYWIHLPVDADVAQLDSYLKLPEIQVQAESSDPLVEQPPEEGSDSQAPRFEIKNGQNRQAVAMMWPKPRVIPESYPPVDQAEIRKGKPVQTTMVPNRFITELKEKLKKKLTVDSYQSRPGANPARPVKRNSIMVRANETLGHYADWLNIRTQRLRVLNHLRWGQAIYQGQRLTLDFSRVSPEEFQERRYRYHLTIIEDFLKKKEFVRFVEYRINPGESIWNIAQQQYGIPVEMILCLNANSNLNRLYPGDILRIPVFQTNNSLEETL